MRKIIAITQVTVDGVMQGPGGGSEEWVHPRRLGHTLRGRCSDAGYRRDYRRQVRHASGTLDLPALRLLLAAPEELDREGVQQGDEIRRLARSRPARLGDFEAHRR